MKTQASHNPQEWINSFMDGCHEMALDHLRPHIQKMFENCNIALLEFSEKAQSSASQIRFMEAGTIIRNNRDKVETVFYRELQQGFTQFKRLSQRGVSSVHAGVNNRHMSEEQLTLISKEDSDIQVAIQNMVASASLGSTHELTAIRQRLAVLNNGCKLQEQQIPAGPDALARAFHKAAGELLLEHELKLIVYLLFDRFVLSKTCSMYDEYNGRLIKAGLLQNLRYEARKNPNAPQPRRNTEQQAPQNMGKHSSATGNRVANSDKSLGDELFDDILDLMSQHHPTAKQTPDNPIPQTELVSAIHRLQENSEHHTVDSLVIAASTDSVASKQAIANMVANLSSERKRLFQGIDRRQLPAADTQVIDLVGMMFEYMLNDAEIPNVAKAELSRLHTPYLKVAIIDKTFFSDNAHPAHVLLNGLARATTRWVFEDNLDRGIFPCLRKIVTRISLDFNKNLDIFPEMLDILHAGLQDLENKATALEGRSRQAAQGREKLELARQSAAGKIEEAVSKHTVPDAIRKLLGDVWRDKLMFIYLREPDADQSDSWKLAAQTIETILWCVEPRSTTEQRENLREQRSFIHNQIKQSLQTLSAYGASNTIEELALIREYTEAAINAADVSATAHCETEDSSLVSQAGHQPAASEAVSEPDLSAALQTTDSQNDSYVATEVATNPATVVEHEGDQAGNHSEANDLTAETRAKMAELETVPFGTWFSLRTDVVHGAVHAKLSWYSGISGNYMFVDRMGIKVAVFKQRELANQLVSGRAEIIYEQEHPLIHRALEAIRRMLGGEQTAHA